MKLGDLFDKYGSDKNRNGYTSIYETILKHWTPKVMLEVGIGTLIEGAPSSMVGYSLPGYKPGGSLRAWRDFCHQRSDTWVYGMDVQPDTRIEGEDHILTILCDSTNREMIDERLKDSDFDLVVDDGLHTHEAQLATMRNLLPRVRPGGFYVVEDIYPGSPFLDQARYLYAHLRWFATEHKNLAVFSL